MSDEHGTDWRSAVLAILALGLTAVVVVALVAQLSEHPAIVGPSIAALGAVAAVVVGQVAQRRLLNIQARREQMLPMYEDFLEAFFESMQAGGTEPTPSFVDVFNRFAQKLLLWGSADVVKAWLNIRSIAARDGQAAEMADGLEQLLLAIRKDLGHRDGKLGHHDLLGTFLNDLHELGPGSSESRTRNG